MTTPLRENTYYQTLFNMHLSEEQVQNLLDLHNAQEARYFTEDGDNDEARANMFYIEDKAGDSVYMPFSDFTCRYMVDPVEEWGTAFINSWFFKWATMPASERACPYCRCSMNVTDNLFLVHGDPDFGIFDSPGCRVEAMHSVDSTNPVFDIWTKRVETGSSEYYIGKAKLAGPTTILFEAHYHQDPDDAKEAVKKSVLEIFSKAVFKEYKRDV